MSWRRRLDGALNGVGALLLTAVGGGVGFAATVLVVDKGWSTTTATAGPAAGVGLLLALLASGARGHEIGGRRGVLRAWAVAVFGVVAAARGATSPVTSTPVATPLTGLGAAAHGGAALLAPPRRPD